MQNLLHVAIAKGYVIAAGMTLLDHSQRLELGTRWEIKKVTLYLIQPPYPCDRVGSREWQKSISVVDRRKVAVSQGDHVRRDCDLGLAHRRRNRLKPRLKFHRNGVYPAAQ